MRLIKNCFKRNSPVLSFSRTGHQTRIRPSIAETCDSKAAQVLVDDDSSEAALSVKASIHPLKRSLNVDPSKLSNRKELIESGSRF